MAENGKPVQQHTFSEEELSDIRKLEAFLPRLCDEELLIRCCDFPGIEEREDGFTIGIGRYDEWANDMMWCAKSIVRRETRGRRFVCGQRCRLFVSLGRWGASGLNCLVCSFGWGGL